MSGTRSLNWRPGDLVPIAERLRNLQIWRMSVLVVAVLAAACFRQLSVVDRTAVVTGTLIFVAVGFGLTRLSMRTNRAGRALLRILLLGDAVAVVALSLGISGPHSPLRYLLILQVVEVSLLASFRTGLKLAAWQSMLISSLYVIGPVVAPHLSTTRLAPTDRLDLQVLVAMTWIAAITTAWLAAANERELRRRRYDLERLARFHEDIEHAETSEAAAAVFAELAADELDATRSVVLVPSDAGDALHVLAAHGLTLDGSGIANGADSLINEAMTSTRTLLVTGTDARRDLALAALLPRASNLAVLPLRTERGKGVLVVEYGHVRASRVERRVVSMLERYRDELGARLSQLWLIDSLRQAATIDPLTGVANRARLRQSLRELTQHATRTGQPLSLLMLDVDHFKRVNDTHGHAAGDDVLRQVASVLKGTVRPYDIVARYGGEEFVVILPGAELSDATIVAERVRAALPAATEPYSVTASFGATRFDPAVDDVDNVIKRADALLYDAKRGGRNRVVAASGTLANQSLPLPAPQAGAVRPPAPPPTLPPR